MSSINIIDNVVEQRDNVNVLFQASAPQSLVDATFIQWSDKSKLILSHELVFKDRSLIENVDNLYDKVALYLEFSDHDSTNKKKSPLLSFGTLGPEISYTSKSCPTIKDIRTRLSNESLVMLVYDYAGYSFSSEFNLIYKGMFESLTAVEDTLAVIRKALTACDPAMGVEQCTLFALFILVRAAWDSQLMLELFQQYFKATFPSIKKFTMQSHDNGLNTRIYVGRQQSGVISFTVRCECSVSLKDDTFKTNETPKPQPLIMYHDYVFDTTTITSAEEMSRMQQQVENERDLDLAEAMKLKFDAARDTQGIRFFLRMNLASDSVAGNAATEVPAPSSSLMYDQLELDSLAPRTSQCSASFCAETFGWGYDSFFSLGLGTLPKIRSEGDNKSKDNNKQPLPNVLDEVHDPRPIPLLRNIALEQVRMISCSARHTLLLTHYGGVYACGDNSEGALGMGDTHPRNAFSPVDMTSISAKIQGKITMIAAGGSVAGSHSMAIDSEGSLYGWGYARAVGVGAIAPLLIPTAVAIQPQDEPSFNTATELQQQQRQRQPSVRSVACGAGFTILVMQSGSVYGTGAWAHGRLGLGDIPQVQSSRGNGKTAKYQLRFIRVIGIETSVAVACGDSHVLCLLASGHVLAWGHNALGQLGTGPLRSGILRDELTPVIVPPFGSKITADSPLARFLLKLGNEQYTRRMECLPHEGHDSLIKGSVICCGAFHSLVMDRRGNIWSWGARGSPCLGHADGKVQGQWSQKVSSIFSVTISEGEVMVPYELLRWCSLWSMPRRIAAFDAPTYTTTNDDDFEVDDYEEVMKEKAIHVVIMTAGDLHSAFLADNGRLYLCGAGPVVPPIYPGDMLLDEDGNGDDNRSDAPSLQSKQSKATITTAAASGEGQIVTSPRCPSAQWMSSLAMRAVKYIASGGCRFIAVCDEETVSINLSLPLYHRLRSAVHAATTRHNNEQSDVESGDEGSSSLLGASSMWSDYSHVLESRGRADCMVICSGHTFLCHRALLAKRSSELRDIILQETPSYVDPDYPSSPEILTQVLLPELHRDAARALSYYLYRDTLPRSVVTQLPLLYSLVQCGKNLKMYRLQMLCERFITLLTHPHDMNQSSLQKEQPSYDPNENSTVAADDNDTGSIKSKATASTRRFILDELPPLTLTRDFGNLLGDPEFADIRFSAEGRTVAAHRFILEARCGYFKAMFRSGMQEMQGQQQGGDGSSARGQIIDVVVPDTFVGFLRLLIFIYTDTLPDGTDGALLEDLMAADRYGMMDMKSLCEQMLVPTKRNWLDLLRAADLLYAPTLQRNVLAFLRDNFDALHLNNAGAFGEEPGESLVSELQEEFPTLLEKLLLTRRVFFPLPPSQALINRTIESKEVKNKATQSPAPLLSLLLMFVFALLYQQISSMISLGWVIPAINVSLALAVVGYFGRKAYNDLYGPGRKLKE